MRGGRGKTILGALGLVVVVAIVTTAYLLSFDRPTPPATLAAEAPFTRTQLEPPNLLEIVPPEATTWIVASDCPSRVTRGAAYLDLCWTATRQRDEDPGKDHFTLHVGGTFGGGARWLIVEAHPLDAGPLLRTEGLPHGETHGCQNLNLETAPLGSSPVGEELCGMIDAGPGSLAGVWHLNWSCEPCLPFDKSDRPILMELQVVVEEGTLPNWDLYADLGQ